MIKTVVKMERLLLVARVVLEDDGIGSASDASASDRSNPLDGSTRDEAH